MRTVPDQTTTWLKLFLLTADYNEKIGHMFLSVIFQKHTLFKTL